MAHCLTNADRLAWLRQYADPGTPDIYNMADAGLVPNGCGPEKWYLGAISIPASTKVKFLGITFTLNLVPNDFRGLPCLEVAGDYHDYLYWLGGGEMGRRHADKMLVWIMRELEKQSHRWWNPTDTFDTARMKIISTAYYLAVRKFGKTSFSFKPVGEGIIVPTDPIYALSFQST